VISVTGGNDVFVNDANHIFFSKNAAEWIAYVWYCRFE
jgi:hypothetical protein